MNKTQLKNGLYWFRHDCRLTDMPALELLSKQVDTLLCVYVMDDEWFNQNQYGCVGLGKHRKTFLLQGLQDLNTQLEALGQRLYVVSGRTLAIINEWIESYHITHLGCAAHCGVNEQDDLQRIKTRQSDVKIIDAGASLLLESTSLPFAIHDMPDTFSPFRKKVEKNATPEEPLSAIQSLPNLPVDAPDKTHYMAHSESASYFTGGESAGLSQLNHYLFETDAVANYKQTRNGMVGWDFSSKLSAWLAAGHVSPRTVYGQLRQYEQQRVKNESTYWLYFELLWREFFHCLMLKHGSKLFALSGIQNTVPSTVFDSEKLDKWCNGKTGYDIVDAAMNELNTTGFMSNRARQLVASCFVHELNLDWRYGAAYFEQQLIDYDVASNYGNWQYLAGVGSDPRGHRQFNLEKQTQIYDQDAKFRQKWLT